MGLTLLDVAGLEATKGAREPMTARLRDARDLFVAVGLPWYVERVEARAREHGAPL